MDESVKDSGCYNLACDHVNWFLELIRPLLITHFEHGYKHGHEDDARIFAQAKTIASQQPDSVDAKKPCAYCDDDFYSCHHCGR